MANRDRIASRYTEEEVYDEADVLHTGKWYIAELELDTLLAVQGESEHDARQKLVKRWEEYVSEDDVPDLSLSSDCEYEFYDSLEFSSL